MRLARSFEVVSKLFGSLPENYHPICPQIKSQAWGGLIHSYLSHKAYERSLLEVNALPRRIGTRAYDNTAFVLLQCNLVFFSFVHIWTWAGASLCLNAEATTPDSVCVIRHESIVDQLLERVPIVGSEKTNRTSLEAMYRPWETSMTISSHIIGLVQPYRRLAFANERRLRLYE